MKKLDYIQIGLLQFLVEKKLNALEKSIEYKTMGPMTLSHLSIYAEIESILKDMKLEAE
jgi:hypothetical protein